MKTADAKFRLAARDALLEILMSHRIPSDAEVAAKIAATTERNSPAPSTKKDQLAFEYGEASSAGKMNRITHSLQRDIHTCYLALSETEDAATKLLEKTLDRVDAITARTREILSRTNDLLLLTADTEGYLAAFSETFSANDMIDMDATTLMIDNAGEVALLKMIQNMDPSAGAIDMSLLGAADIRVALRTPEVLLAPGTRNSELTDMLADNSRPWIYTVQSSTQKQITVEVVIDLGPAIRDGREYLNISRMMIDVHSIGNNTQIITQVSKDSIDWRYLTRTPETRDVSGPVVYMSDGMREARYIRILMSKTVQSRREGRSTYIYDFGINRISISDRELVFVDSGILVTKPLSFDDDSGPVKIRKAALALACDTINTDTAIEYDLVFLDAAGVELSRQRVVPLNSDREGVRIATLNDGEIPTVSASIEVDTPPVVENPALSGRLRPLDQTIGRDGTVTIWRNAGQKGVYKKIYQVNDQIVEEGWLFDGADYYTFFELDEPMTIDFGPTSAWLDGVRVTGSNTISKGLHNIRTSSANWRSLKGMGSVTEFDLAAKRFAGTVTRFGEDGMAVAPDVLNGSVIDGLYPYNHKLLVEGVSFEADAAGGDRCVYRGASRFGILMRQRSEVEMSSMETVFEATRSFSLSDTEASERRGVNVIIPRDHRSDSGRESFVIAEKRGYASAVKLEAMMSTLNPTITPVLTGYKIKVSN